MHTLDEAETQALLPYPALAHAIREILLARQTQPITAPPRMAVPLAADGTLLLMPAATATLAITKLVTVHPHNAARQLPSVQADILVLEAATGRRLYMLPGEIVTARRTAALSLLAAQTLAPRPDGPLLIVGAGTQGRAHLEAFAEGLGVRQISIASRTFAHAERLADAAQQRGLSAHAVTDPLVALKEATLIVTATTSARPVLPAQVRPDALICAVGAYVPSMAELPPALVQQARVYVDTLEGAQAEAGDLIQAHVDWSQVTPLEQALTQPRPPAGPIIFKSVGHALWDLAAASLVHARNSKPAG
ncbi:MAG TPA: delta(1)-pyrroline-2-carboxylate reductase family protein [Herpetosiphonaceae bacterium]